MVSSHQRRPWNPYLSMESRWELHPNPDHLASTIDRDNDLPPLPSGTSADDVFTDFIKHLFGCIKSYIRSIILAIHLALHRVHLHSSEWLGRGTTMAIPSASGDCARWPRTWYTWGAVVRPRANGGRSKPSLLCPKPCQCGNN